MELKALLPLELRTLGLLLVPKQAKKSNRSPETAIAFGAKITYILQEQPAGLAHAVKIAQPFLGDSPFIMYLGDNIIEGKVDSFLAQFNQQISMD
jgi:glucose-1-phosphate thymidylyltransferase